MDQNKKKKKNPLAILYNWTSPESLAKTISWCFLFNWKLLCLLKNVPFPPKKTNFLKKFQPGEQFVSEISLWCSVWGVFVCLELSFSPNSGFANQTVFVTCYSDKALPYLRQCDSSFMEDKEKTKTNQNKNSPYNHNVRSPACRRIGDFPWYSNGISKSKYLKIFRNGFEECSVDSKMPQFSMWT